jgi:hypothetical protein
VLCGRAGAARDRGPAAAEAAWWLGLLHECLHLTEQLHHRYIEAGDVDRAAAQALELSAMLAMRGEFALASGWLGRARRLLADRPIGFAHGLLAYVDLSQSVDEGRFDEAASAAEELRRLGERLGVDTLRALGSLGMGVVEVRRGHLSEGFGNLDEAMLPVVAGTVARTGPVTSTARSPRPSSRSPTCPGCGSGLMRRTAGCKASRTR